MSNLERRLDALESREAIRDVLHLYCRSADRGDAALMQSCYHPEATDDHGFFSGLARDFVPHVMGHLAQLPLCIHTIGNSVITLDGDSADVESHWSVIHRIERTTALADLWQQGRYLDRFERRDGQWKISTRRAVLDAERWISAVELANLADAGAPYLPLRGRRDAADPVYAPPPARHFSGMSDLWGPYRQAFRLPIWLLHILGRSGIAKSRLFSNLFHPPRS